MKNCPNCQAAFNDDSLKFCLNCGTPLPAAEVRQSKGSGGIIAAILGGFLILTLAVGGVGLYLFRQPSSEVAQTNANSKQNDNDDPKEIVAPQNSDKIPSVEQLNANRKTVPFPSSNTTTANNAAAPRIVASSSSVRKQQAGNFYFPNFAFDNNPATAWCEGAAGAGVGEWLQFNFDREVTLKQIKMQPGYFKNSETWQKNNRVSEITVQLSDGSTEQFSFADEMKTQPLDIAGKRTRWVRITLDDFYKGSSDAEDTLISEVSFVTEP
jgi:hypothetical protein